MTDLVPVRQMFADAVAALQQNVQTPSRAPARQGIADALAAFRQTVHLPSRASARQVLADAVAGFKQLRPPSLAPLEETASVPFADWRKAARTGYVIVIFGFGLSVAWAATAQLDGAAVAQGVVAVESNRKTIQHLEGGIVREILVRNGDLVKEGQPLLRLDPTRVDAQGEISGNLVASLMAQETRLFAERDELPELVFPTEVMVRSTTPVVAKTILDQMRQFHARREALTRNQDVALAQIQQLHQEIDQNKVDLVTARATLKNVGEELEALRPLFEKRLVPTGRISPLEREKLRLEGVIGNAELQSIKLREKLGEAKLRRDQVSSDYRQDASTQLVDVRRQLNDARQQLIVAEDTQRRSEVRAPTAGTIQQLRVFTIGGVLRPGDPVLDLVPASDVMVIQAKILPLDIDRVTPGLRAEIRFPSFRYFGSDVIWGTLRTVSRDRLLEDNGKDAYFACEISVDRAALPPDVASRVSAGIPADVIIRTEARTTMTYLLGPIFERMNKGMRER